MLTQNFINSVLATTSSPTVVDTEGVSRSNMNPEGALNLYKAFFTSGSFVLGDGDTQASKSDINLSNSLDMSDFDAGTIQISTVATGGVTKRVFQNLFTFTGNSTTIIREVGLVYTNSWSGSGSTTATILVAREVLDSPITVNYGDTFAVSMVIG